MSSGADAFSDAYPDTGSEVGVTPDVDVDPEETSGRERSCVAEALRSGGGGEDRGEDFGDSCSLGLAD